MALIILFGTLLVVVTIMSQLLMSVCLLYYLYTVKALTEVDIQCIKDNSEPFNNDYLVGTWFRVYRFAPGATYPPSCACIEDHYIKPTNHVIQAYKDKYNDPNLPYSLDDNPVIKTNKWWEGIVTGNTRAKFYMLTPNSTARLTDGYSVIAYKPLSEKYVMTTECAMRNNFRWLLSRDKNSSVEEMKKIIEKTPEFESLDGQRFCAVDKWCFN